MVGGGEGVWGGGFGVECSSRNKILLLLHDAEIFYGLYRYESIETTDYI